MENGKILYEKYKEVLNKTFLLKELEKEGCYKLLSRFREEQWPKNTCILNSERFKFHFFIIISGRVKMYQLQESTRKEITLFLLSKNDVFDLFCFLDGYEHEIYYECLDKVKVLAISMENFRDWFKNHPEHYEYILPYVGKQMRMLENFVSDMTFTDISTRLIKLLLRNTGGNSNLELINDLSNKEIACLIGSTGAVVNRHLQKLKRNGSIKTSRSSLEIKDLNILLHLLEEEKKKIKS